MEGSKELRLGKQGYSVEEIARAYEVSIPFMRLEIKRGNLRALRFGRRVVVTREQLNEYLERAAGR